MPLRHGLHLASLSLCLVLLGGGTAHAATYYLAPTGDDDNPGTMEAPFFTLVRAWEAIGPGDTLYLRGGTYAWPEQQYLQLADGAPGALIKVWAYPGETPILTQAAGYVGQDLIYFEGSYIHWKGLEIAYFRRPDYGWSGFRSEQSNHCIYEQIHYHHNRSGFAIRANSNDNLILNSDFHHNADPEEDYEGGDGLNVSYIRPGFSNTIRGCRAWWNGDDGFDVWANAGHILIESSWAFYNGYIGDTFEIAGNGSGFKLGETEPSPDLLREVHNCLAYKNQQWGFVENNARVVMHLYNNSSVLNGGRNFWFGSWNAAGTADDHPITARNNLAYGPAGDDPDLGGLAVTFSAFSILDHNTWANAEPWDDLSLVTEADFESLDESQLVAPRKADGSLPDITFLHLAATSDLIGAGVDVGLPYAGDAPDLGAFERGLVAPGADAGPSDPDGGAVDGDGAPIGGDGGLGANDPASGSCGCEVGGRAPASGLGLGLGLAAGLGLVALRRRRRG